MEAQELRALALDSDDRRGGSGARPATGAGEIHLDPALGLRARVPIDRMLVRELLPRTRRAYAQRGARPMQAARAHEGSAAGLVGHLRRIAAGETRPRLAALCLGDRRSATFRVGRGTMENLRRVDARSSSGSYLYPLTHSKTHQAGVERPEDVKPLVGSAAAAMQA